MNLTGQYNLLWEDAISKFDKGNFELDDQINSQDLRRGMTLLIRPGEKIRQSILQFQNKLAEIEPAQYYHPINDIHITLLSIVSCYEGFSLSEVAVEEYVKLIKPCIDRIKPFKIEFQGITASPSGILLQGFPPPSLNELRDQIRQKFRQSDIQQSIDRRYKIQTAHSTVVRFTQAPSNPKLLIETLKKYRNFDFGETEVRTIDLTHNDWYLRNCNTTLLHEFKLDAF